MTSAAEQQLEHLVELRRWADARRVLRGALQETPDDPELHAAAARVELGAGRLDEAERSADAALALAPENRRARVVRFAVLRRQDRHAEAEEAILDLLREDPTSAGLLALYAWLMVETLHLEKARALVDEALRLDPSDPTAGNLDAILSIIEGRHDGAEARLAALLRDDPDGEEVIETLLHALVARQRFRATLPVARQLLRARPDDPGLAETVIELRAVTHWSSLPLWPIHRFGWTAVIGLWLAAAFGLRLASRAFPKATAVAAVAWLGYVAYSWIQPPLVRRWVRWRGVR